MNKTFLVHGLKRSGNHAIINWIQAHDNFYFFNNIIPIAAILKGEKKLPPAEDFNRWCQRKLLPKHLPFANLTLKIKTRKHSLIASLEDHPLDVKPFISTPNDLKNILIIRDPYNLFASRIRKASLVENPAYSKTLDVGLDRAISLWKAHAREYVGETNIITNKVGVYFNHWFSSKAYRKQLSDQLGFPHTDRGYANVSNFGGGSSFDSTKFNGETSKMDILNRQDKLNKIEVSLLTKITMDNELIDLYQKVQASSN